MPQAKLCIEKAVPELELKVEGEFDFIRKEQIALSAAYSRSTGGFVDQLIVLENRIDLLERSRPTSRFKLKTTKVFAHNLNTLQLDDNQTMEPRSEIGTEVDLSFTRVADRVGREEVHMATLSGNSQLFNNRIRWQRTKKTKASCPLHHNDYESI